MAKNKSEMYDTKSGYTADMFELQSDIRLYAKFIGTFIRLDLVEIRIGQILVSNYGQARFDQLRNEGFKHGPSLR